MTRKNKKERNIEDLYRDQNISGTFQPTDYQFDPYRDPVYGNSQPDDQNIVYRQYNPDINPATGRPEANYQEKDINRPQKTKAKKDRPKTEEQVFKSRLRKKYVLRGVLITLNLALIGYFLFEITSLITGYIEKDRQKKNDYISLCGLSKKESDSLYAKYALDGYKEVFDYALIGNRLFLSDRRIDASNLSTMATLQLVNVDTELEQVALLDSLRFDIDRTDFNSGIDLSVSALKDGDYLVYERTAASSYPLKVKNRKIELKYYTAPEEGKRREVSIKNTVSSKAMVISVKTTDSVPVNYYDAVVATESENFSLPSGLENYKIKIITGSDYFRESYRVWAPIAINITEDPGKTKSCYDKSSVLTSRLFTDSEVISEGRLSGFDSADFIREMSGYIQYAGQCIEGTEFDSCQVSDLVTDEHIGKKAYILNSYSDLAQELKILLSI